MPHSTVHPSTTTIEGQQISVAPLPTIDYGRLASKDPAEVENLLAAAQTLGFFHLDLQSEPTGQMLSDLRHVYAVMEKYMDETAADEVKTKGYSEQMVNFEILRAHLLQDTLTLPPSLSSHLSLLARFSHHCHTVNTTILASLSDALALSPTNRFENQHRDAQPSDTALNLIYAPAKRKLADVPDTTHTDTGTLTTLFCDLWGIQVEDPKTKAWSFAEPKPGCALVNVADSLQALSGDRLHSSRHRHTQPVDGFQKRYFVVSYLRPEKGGLFITR